MKRQTDADVIVGGRHFVELASVTERQFVAIVHSNLSRMIQISLIAQQDDGNETRNFHFVDLLQKIPGAQEAVPVANTVHHHEGVAPLNVFVETPRRLVANQGERSIEIIKKKQKSRHVRN